MIINIDLGGSDRLIDQFVSIQSSDLIVVVVVVKLLVICDELQMDRKLAVSHGNQQKRRHDHQHRFGRFRSFDRLTRINPIL
jgi:hypothetical protein